MNKKQALTASFVVIVGIAILLSKLDYRSANGGGNAGLPALNPPPKLDDRDPESIKLTNVGAPRQAANLQAQTALAVERFRDLPFRPDYGDEVFDSTKALGEKERQKWQRHCRLRNAYASERIREPAFLELYHLMNRYGLSDNISNLCYLNDIAYGLSTAIEHATDYSPELVSVAGKSDLKEFLEERISWYRDIVANVYGVEVDDDLMTALMEIHPKGGIGDPDTHVEPGERIILN